MHRLRYLLSSVFRIALFAAIFCMSQACYGPQQPSKPSPKSASAASPQPKPSPPTPSPEPEPTPQVPTHSEAETLQFLDSIRRLDWRTLDDSVKFDELPEPGFRKDKYLSKQQFAELKAGCSNGKISQKLTKFLLPNKLDERVAQELEAKDSFPIQYEPIGKGAKFGYYAIVINTDDWWGAEMVAFFEGNHLVETHDIYYHYALKVGTFMDSAWRRFVWYNNDHGTGAGVAQFHLSFYLWEKSQFLPALEILEIGSLSYWPRSYGLDGSIFSTNPLAIKFTYAQYLPDPNDSERYFPEVNIVDDSTIVQFVYDTLARRFKGNWSASKLKYPQMLTYINDENDLLFIYTHHKRLRQYLLAGDAAQNRATRYYLSKVMDGDYPKGNDKR